MSPKIILVLLFFNPDGELAHSTAHEFESIEECVETGDAYSEAREGQPGTELTVAMACVEFDPAHEFIG